MTHLDALRVPIPGPESYHAYYKFYAYVRPEALKSDWSRERIMTEISERGVFCNAGGCSEMYREEAFRKNALQPANDCPVAHQLGDTSLMFQVHPTLQLWIWQSVRISYLSR